MSRAQHITQWRGHDVLSGIARLLLAVVFIWASFHKILHPGDFALNVATYQILPLSLINLQAIGLPWVEMLCGVTLLLGLWTRETALVTVGMNVMFIVALLMTLHRSEEIMCGCFASADAGHQIGMDLVVRDVGLLLVGLYLVWIGPRKPSVDNLLRRKKETSHA